MSLLVPSPPLSSVQFSPPPPLRRWRRTHLLRLPARADRLPASRCRKACDRSRDCWIAWLLDLIACLIAYPQGVRSIACARQLVAWVRWAAASATGRSATRETPVVAAAARRSYSSVTWSTTSRGSRGSLATPASSPRSGVRAVPTPTPAARALSRSSRPSLFGSGCSSTWRVRSRASSRRSA